jgi:hypothetical protein
MKNSIEASQIQAIADLGWKDTSLSDEEYRIRLMKVLNG